jgi:hypothetical protein
MRVIRALLRNKWFLLACAIAGWAGFEVGGKGTGVFNRLLSPGLTRDQGFHLLDVVGGRPKGPARLTAAEAESVDARLTNAFGGNVLAHRRTSAMREFYELKADAHCVRDRVDFKECNRIERMEVFFGAILRAMHPATEHVLWLEKKSDERGPGQGRMIRIAVFLGADEKVKVAFNLRRVRDSAGFETVSSRAIDSSGPLRDLPGKEVGDGVWVVDYPGPALTPEAKMRIQVCAGTNPPENIILSWVTERAAHHKFFSAVLGKPVGDADGH